MGKLKKQDGLNNWQRYRLKDLEEYRKKKREYAKTPEQKIIRAAYMRKYSKENREKMNQQANISHAKTRARKTPEERHAQHLKYAYGITREHYLKMLSDQDGKCLICGIDRPRGNKSWHVDHDHKTGKIRGLLCNYCNPRLGWCETYKDKITEYLNR